MDAAGQMDGTHGHLGSGDVDGVHCNHGLGAGSEVVKGGEKDVWKRKEYRGTCSQGVVPGK